MTAEGAEESDARSEKKKGESAPGSGGGPGGSGGAERVTVSEPGPFPGKTGGARLLEHLRTHYRECRRKNVDAEVELKVVLEDTSEFDSGTARIKNISPTGALLTDVKLERGVYPVGPFSLEIGIRSGAYEGIMFRAIPVRLVPEQHGLGVKFEEIFVHVAGSEAPGESGR